MYGKTDVRNACRVRGVFNTTRLFWEDSRLVFLFLLAVRMSTGTPSKLKTKERNQFNLQVLRRTDSSIVEVWHNNPLCILTMKDCCFIELRQTVPFR